MKEDNALMRLRDDEPCLLTMKDGVREARWSVANWCFFYLDRGTPVVCRAEDIDEWCPVSMLC